MADGAGLGSVVMFVQDLDRSVSFYADVLALKVADRSSTAALLISGAGSQLILRAMGRPANRALGSVGVQYVVWTEASEADLDRCEQVLKSRSAHCQRRASESVEMVEGRDPDDIVVAITYPGPEQVPLHQLPVRVYGW
jgi:catechol 2,3-dioxygenase-like lactoylglutathione lyase family enzyme